MVMFKDAPSENGTSDGGGGAIASQEFLTAMAIAPGSNFAGKTVAQAGIHKLPNLFEVSTERTRMNEEEEETLIAMSMKKQNNAMIFNALYLNDHNEIWDVGHSIGKL